MILGAVAALGLITRQISSAVIARLDWTIERLRVGRVSPLLVWSPIVDLTIHNRTSVAADFALSGQVYYGTTPLGTVSLPTQTYTATGDIPISLTLSVDLKKLPVELLNRIVSAVNNPTSLLSTLKFAGTAVVNGVSIPVNTNIPIA